MKYDSEIIYQKAIELIKKNKLFFVEDVVALLPISKPTFYEYFKVDTDEFNELKKLLGENVVKTKIAIRGKLFKGKGMELIALYKLIGTDEERKRLSQTYHEEKTEDDKNSTITLKFDGAIDMDSYNEDNSEDGS